MYDPRTRGIVDDPGYEPSLAVYRARRSPESTIRPVVDLVIVVVQLVLALGVSALRTLALIALLRRPHRHVVRARRMHRRKGKLALESGALAPRAGRRVRAAHQ